VAAASAINIGRYGQLTNGKTSPGAARATGWHRNVTVTNYFVSLRISSLTLSWRGCAFSMAGGNAGVHPAGPAARGRLAAARRRSSIHSQREFGIQSFAPWHGYPTCSLAAQVIWHSPVLQRLNQVNYVTVTKMRGYGCTAEVSDVAVSADVDDIPSGSICHVPTPTSTSQSRTRPTRVKAA
jgi:hypothetical protein